VNAPSVVKVGDRVRLNFKGKMIRTEEMQDMMGTICRIEGERAAVLWDKKGPVGWSERMEWLEPAAGPVVGGFTDVEAQVTDPANG
jgi:hypothetical protein